MKIASPRAILGASLLSAAMLFAMPVAHAASNDISTAPQTLVMDFGQNTLSFGNTFAGVLAGDTFAERFSFTLPGITEFQVSLTSISTSTNTGLDLTGFGLYDALTNEVVTAGRQKATGVIEKWSLSATDLAAGSYYFLVSGTMVSDGAAFAGNGAISISAVPEPTGAAMLLGGLGLLAFIARRRRG